MVSQMRRILLCLLIALLSVPGARAAGNQPTVIRLHILAHNNTAAEQAAKLSLRNALLQEISELLKDAQNIHEASSVVTKNLPRLELLASQELSSLGSQHTISLMWGSFPFPARAYRQVALPAGVYPALYVNIGAGRGANWWCIMYPPLCYVPGVVRRTGESRHEFALLNLLRSFWRRIVAN